MEKTVDNLLSKLEEIIRSGKRQLLSNNRIVDDQSCLEIIAQIRETLPQALAEARVVLLEKNKMFEQTQQQCTNMLYSAKQQSDIMLEQSEIIKAAQIRANSIIEEANNFANNIVAQSYNHINELLSSVEYNVSEVLEKVSASRKELSSLIKR